MKKIILKKLKFNRKKNKSGKKRKNDRNKRTNKLKSGSLTKRDIHRSQKTEGILPEKMQTIEKSDKKLGLSPSHSINNFVIQKRLRDIKNKYRKKHTLNFWK